MLSKIISFFFILTFLLSDTADAKTLLYVTHETKGKIAVYDANSEKLIKNISTAESPFHLALLPNKKQIAVSHKGAGANYLKIIDSASGAAKPSATIIVGRYRRTGEVYLTFNKEGKKLYAIDSNMNYVDVIDTGKWALLKRVILGIQPKKGILSSDGNALIIPNLISREIIFFDVLRDKVSRSIKINGLPSAVAFSNDGERLFVLDKENSLLLSMDLQSGKIIGSAVVGNEPVNLLLSPDGSAIYAANYASNSLTVINAKTTEVIANIAVGIQPFGMAVDDKTGMLYVCNYGEASISIIDAKTNRVIRKIPTDVTPTNLIIVRE
jgi:YVTN family beta-propeller protein